MCSTRICGASELMHDEISIYVAMFNLLKCELYAGQTLKLLDMAGATEEDIYIFAVLNGTLNEIRAKQAKNN